MIRKLLIIKYLLLFFCIITQFSLFSQKVEADKLMAAGKYEDALLLIKEKFDQKSSNELLLKLAICQFQTNKLDEGQRNLQFLVENNFSDPEVMLFLGKIAHHKLKFDEAIQYYKKYLRLTPSAKDKRTVVQDVKRCYQGQVLLKKEKLCIVDNLGDNINTNFDEIAPVPSPSNEDKIYFSSNRSDTEGGLRNIDGLRDEQYGNYCADMYAGIVADGEWKETKAIGNLLNSPRHDILKDISANGKVLYFFKGFTQTKGELFVDTFKVNPEERPIEQPKFITPMYANEGDVYFHLFTDTFLIFASQRLGGFGGYDLYVSEFQNNEWSNPKNLGPNINTPYDEICPYLSYDGRTLYFSSNNEKSVGGFDVFKCRFNNNNVDWQRAENVGFPINSAGDDIYFRLTRDGYKAFLSSNRKEGFGGYDIYNVLFNALQEEQSERSKPIVFTQIPPFDSTNQVKQLEKSSAANTISFYEFSPFYYDNEDNVLGQNTIRQLNKLVKLSKEIPQATFDFTCHSDETGPSGIDLYFCIKRAEKIQEYLLKQGVSINRIQINSCGSNYPIAENYNNGKPNISGQKMNRRIDLVVRNIDENTVRLAIEKPQVNEVMASADNELYQNKANGLVYRIQIASIKQMYKGNIINQKDSYIDKNMDTGQYRYSIGLFTSFSDAQKELATIKDEGIKDAIIIPFINGVRMNSTTANSFKKDFPDLQKYLLYNKSK